MNYKFMVYLNPALNRCNEYTNDTPFVNQNIQT